MIHDLVKVSSHRSRQQYPKKSDAYPYRSNVPSTMPHGDRYDVRGTLGRGDTATPDPYSITRPVREERRGKRGRRDPTMAAEGEKMGK